MCEKTRSVEFFSLSFRPSLTYFRLVTALYFPFRRTRPSDEAESPVSSSVFLSAFRTLTFSPSQTTLPPLSFRPLRLPSALTAIRQRRHWSRTLRVLLCQAQRGLPTAFRRRGGREEGRSATRCDAQSAVLRRQGRETESRTRCISLHPSLRTSLKLMKPLLKRSFHLRS
jgi:hypothetical protein